MAKRRTLLEGGLEQPGIGPFHLTERDGYGNRILLCPNDHTMVDKQPGKWTETMLLEVKTHHERIMRLRTEEAKSSSGIQFENPGPIVLDSIVSGGELARMMGRSLAHQMDCSELDGPEERVAAELFQAAADWGDIYGDIGPSGHADAAENLAEHIREALEAGLMLFGKVVDMNVRVAGGRDRWPVVILLMRRTEDVARDQREHPGNPGAGDEVSKTIHRDADTPSTASSPES